MPQLDSARLLLWQAMREQGRMVMASTLNTSVFEIQATLFHLGQVDEFPRRVNLAARCDFQRRWDAVAPRVAETFTHYLERRSGLRSLFTVLKGQKLVFTHPLAGIRTGAAETREPCRWRISTSSVLPCTPPNPSKPR